MQISVLKDDTKQDGHLIVGQLICLHQVIFLELYMVIRVFKAKGMKCGKSITKHNSPRCYAQKCSDVRWTSCDGKA